MVFTNPSPSPSLWKGRGATGGSHGRHAVLCTSLLLCAALSGCSASDANSDRALSGQLKPGDPAIVPREPIREEYRLLGEAGEPMSFGDQRYSDGTPMHYADGSPTYHGDGRPIDYRPRNIQQAMTRLLAVYIRDDGQNLLGFEGGAQRPQVRYLSAGLEYQVRLPGEFPDPRVDPATGKTCWLPFVCTNPKCPGRSRGKPLIFAPAVTGVTPDPGESPAGKGQSAAGAQQAKASSGSSAFDAIHCPKCRQRETLRRPVLPEVEQRLAELQAELARVRGE